MSIHPRTVHARASVRCEESTNDPPFGKGVEDVVDVLEGGRGAHVGVEQPFTGTRELQGRHNKLLQRVRKTDRDHCSATNEHLEAGAHHIGVPDRLDREVNAGWHQLRNKRGRALRGGDRVGPALRASPCLSEFGSTAITTASGAVAADKRPATACSFLSPRVRS